MRESSLTQRHILRVNLSFHSINLSVKFACNIVLTLKTLQDKLICQTIPRPLSNGFCLISQQLELEWQSIYDVGRSQYFQTSMEIKVLVTSSNGTIEAGHCTIDITKNMSQSAILLKKCSDKSASICISCNYQFLHNVQQRQQRQYGQLNVSKSSAHLSNISINKQLRKMRSQEMLKADYSYDKDYNMSPLTIATPSNLRVQQYLRAENEQLTRQNDHLKEKVKYLDRKEKEMAYQLRQSKIKKDKISNKSLQFQNIYQTRQMIVNEKDKIIKSLQTQIKRLEQNNKYQIDQQRALEKKIDIKQQTHQQQSKKANDRISNLQIQLQKITFTNSSLLSKYEQIQKNSQIISRERERALITQKARFTKELNLKEQEIEKLQRERDVIKEKFQQNQYIRRKQNNNYDLNKIIDQKNAQITILIEQKAKLKAIYKQVKQQFDQMKQNEQSRQVLRKKINQFLSEKYSLQIQIEKNNQLLNANEIRIKELIEKTQQLERQKRIIQKKYDQMMAENIQKHNRFVENEKQLNLMRKKYEDAVESQNEMKDMAQQTEKRLRQELQEWTNQFSILNAQRDKYLNDSNDIRWEVQQLKQEIKENHIASQALKKQNFIIRQQLLVNSEKYDHFQIAKNQYQKQIQKYMEDLDVKDNRIRELQKELGQKITIINAQIRKNYQAHLKLEDLAKQNSSLEQKLEQIQMKHETQVEYHNTRISQLLDEAQMLKNQTNQKFESLTTQNKELKTIQNSLNEMALQNRSINQQNIKFSSQLNHKQTQLRVLKQKAKQIQKEKDRMKICLENEQQTNKQLTRYIENYKQKNSEAVRWILCLLGQEQLIIQQSTVFLPEQNLRQLEVEAVKNRNLLLRKLKRSYNAIREEKQFLVQQLQKIGNELTIMTQDYEQVIQKQRSDRYNFEKQILNQRNILANQNEDLGIIIQQLRVSSDNYYKETKLLQHKIQEFEIEQLQNNEWRRQMTNKQNQLNHEISKLNEKILLIKRQVEMSKLAEDEEGHFTLKQQIDRKDQQFQDLVRILSKNKQQIIAKDEKIKMIEDRAMLLQSQKRKIQFDISVKLNLFQQSENKTKELQLVKFELIQKIKELENEIDNMRKEYDQKELDTYHCSSKSIELENKLSKAQQAHYSMNEDLKELSAQLLARNQELKDAKNKQKQAEQNFNKDKQNMEQEINRLAGEIDIYKIIIEKTDEKVQEYNSSNQDFIQQLNMKKQTILKLENEKQLLQTKIMIADEQNSILALQYKQITQAYEKSTSEIELLQENQLKLEQQLQIMKESINLKNQSINQAQDTKLKLCKQAQDLRKRLDAQCNKAKKAESIGLQLKVKMRQIQALLQRKQFEILTVLQQKEQLKYDYQQQIQQLSKYEVLPNHTKEDSPNL